MRPIWKGAISFGMVTIPVKLYTATESKDVRFRLLHKDDGAPIEEKRFCTADGKEVAWDDLVRGYEVSKGEFVVLDPEEIDAAKPESSTTIEIGDFVEAEEIDPVYFEKSYFLEPTEVGAKPFSLLKRALEETERVALARVTIRTRERLATLRVYEDTLMVETMFWPDEIRSTGALDLPEGGEKTVRAKELSMARSLVESLADRFKPDEYTDTYRTALEQLIEQKMRGETRNAKRRKPEPKVIDLMEALKASVDDAKKRGTKRGTKSRSKPGRSSRRKRAKADKTASRSAA
jgi:DNA end-binding protein Ku